MVPPELAATLALAVDTAVASDSEALRRLCRDIHENPELRFEEVKASAWVCELLAARGFTVERGLAGMPTSFAARAGKAGGPRVAILAEYDALPQIGHACGHNLIATGAVGAFLAAAKSAEAAGGEVVLLGTPAEEGGGGKIKMLEAGCFAGLDAAIMFHPFDRDILAHPALASAWVTFTFHGQPAHAAAAPHDGHSALTACMDTFRLVDGQRVHFRDGVRVHGFITNGGQAVNIIPELAACEFGVRATNGHELERVRAIVERCARGAAMASGVRVDVSTRTGYSAMRNNFTLARRFGDHLAARGRSAEESTDKVGAGSTDMGDVSQSVPAIHPYLAICDVGESLCHEHRFAECAGSERGFATALDAARALAKTALELLADADLRRAVRDEFEAAHRP